MSAESAVYTALSGAAPVAAIVGNRIYPDARQEETDLPAVVFVRTGTAFDLDVHGAIDLTRATLAVICLASTRTAVEGLADAAQAAIVAAYMAPLDRISDFDPESLVYTSTLVIEHRA